MRTLRGLTGRLVALWAAGTAAIHVYFAATGFPDPLTMRAIHLGLLLPLAFLLYPARPGRSPADRPSVPDLALALAATAAPLFVLWDTNGLYDRMEFIDALSLPQKIMGILCVVTIVEGLRRAVTPVLAGLVVLGILYMLVGHLIPGMFGSRDFPFWQVVEAMVWVPNAGGAFGPLTGIAATLVAIFIVFGAAIEVSGVGNLFHNLGTKVAGRFAGGPAKVEVLSSALFGTISGSSTANVYATGSFTIPAMVHLGYRRAFAGGVEAASSVGGQIMPPVMGAGAFVMAELTNIPYASIAISAILGSVLYFLMILVSVHFEAKRLRLSGVPEHEIPSWRTVGMDAHLLIPVVGLIVLLALGFSPHLSAVAATALSILACMLLPHTRMTAYGIFTLAVTAGRNMVIIALACSGAGLVVSALTNTGLVVAVGQTITSVSGGNLMIAGAMLMVTTLVLGMGVPTTAAYVIGAAVGAPLLAQLGVPLLSAHMFVFYFSILADATPPVSVASYAAASIAKADPMKVGLVAFRLALAGFVVGFNYLYTPALLLEGPWHEWLAEFLVNSIGLTALAACLSGYFMADLPRPVRIAGGATAVVLVLLETWPVWGRIGAELLLLVLLWLAGRALAPAPQPAQ